MCGLASANQEADFVPSEGTSHSRSFVQRHFMLPPLTATAIAFFWPTMTTSRFPRVTPV
jgi:hypothetical protein